MSVLHVLACDSNESLPCTLPLSSHRLGSASVCNKDKSSTLISSPFCAVLNKINPDLFSVCFSKFSDYGQKRKNYAKLSEVGCMTVVLQGLVDFYLCASSLSKVPFISTDNYSKLLITSVLTNNKAMLNALIKDNKKVATVSLVLFLMFIAASSLHLLHLPALHDQVREQPRIRLHLGHQTG